VNGRSAVEPKKDCARGDRSAPAGLAGTGAARRRPGRSACPSSTSGRSRLPCRPNRGGRRSRSPPGRRPRHAGPGARRAVARRRRRSPTEPGVRPGRRRAAARPPHFVAPRSRLPAGSGRRRFALGLTAISSSSSAWRTMTRSGMSTLCGPCSRRGRRGRRGGRRRVARRVGEALTAARGRYPGRGSASGRPRTRGGRSACSGRRRACGSRPTSPSL
jgi:hypothetical protein